MYVFIVCVCVCVRAHAYMCAYMYISTHNVDVLVVFFCFLFVFCFGVEGGVYMCQSMCMCVGWIGRGYVSRFKITLLSHQRTQNMAEH